VLRPEGRPAEHCTLFLHGILGTGVNLRPVAQALMRSDPSMAAVLVDLRQHGRSQGFPPPHDIAHCADDLVALASLLPAPVTEVVGHSFGGKVALAYHARRTDLTRVSVLDSGPGTRPDRHGSEQTTQVIEMLERAPARFARREEFLDYVQARGHSRAIADWLAMNLERTEDGFRSRLDMPSIRALLDDYFVQDLWPVIENSQARIDVVIGGRSNVWDAEDRARIHGIAEQRHGHVFVHLLPDAGHWVHVDDLPGLTQALEP
jgi:pimeloyl-ACP methyl ester carboxylesterase